jgi:beta-glucosidase
VTDLEGFTRVPLAGGESVQVQFIVSRAQLGVLDATMQRVVEPGRLRVMLGAFSKDIGLRREIQIH